MCVDLREPYMPIAIPCQCDINQIHLHVKQATQKAES